MKIKTLSKTLALTLCLASSLVAINSLVSVSGFSIIEANAETIDSVPTLDENSKGVTIAGLKGRPLYQTDGSVLAKVYLGYTLVDENGLQDAKTIYALRKYSADGDLIYSKGFDDSKIIGTDSKYLYSISGNRLKVQNIETLDLVKEIELKCSNDRNSISITSCSLGDTAYFVYSDGERVYSVKLDLNTLTYVQDSLFTYNGTLVSTDIISNNSYIDKEGNLVFFFGLKYTSVVKPETNSLIEDNSEMYKIKLNTKSMEIISQQMVGENEVYSSINKELNRDCYSQAVTCLGSLTYGDSTASYNVFKSPYSNLLYSPNSSLAQNTACILIVPDTENTFSYSNQVWTSINGNCTVTGITVPKGDSINSISDQLKVYFQSKPKGADYDTFEVINEDFNSPNDTPYSHYIVSPKYKN